MAATHFYTNVHCAGNTVFVREIVNGERKVREVVDYRPIMYLPVNRDTGLRAPDNTRVEPKQFESIRECRDFIKQYESAKNFRIYGNTNFSATWINEQYPQNDIEFDSTKLSICNLDIEVACENGFSEAKDAHESLTAITFKNSLDGIFHVFGMGEFLIPDGPDGRPRRDIKYYHCEDELALIESFLQLWEIIKPDIVTGWNIKIFDIPYLVNRITRVMDEKQAKRLSPWKMIREKVETLFHRDVFVYEIAGVATIDYMAIYRKNVMSPRESYSLNNIANVELKEQKIAYSEVESLHALYRTNHQKFIEYNIHDVELVDKLDAKLKLIELQLVVAYDSKVPNYEDVFSQVRTWDTAIHNHLLRQGVVLPQKVSHEKTTSYAGAYVMEPLVGMFDWVMSFDVTSLYPTIMRLLNMGNESKVDKRTMTVELRQYLETFTSRAPGGDPKGPEILLNGGADIQKLRDMKVTLAANGVLYHREPASFYSEMIEHLLNRRVSYKDRAQRGKRLIEKIHSEQKRRPTVVAVAVTEPLTPDGDRIKQWSGAKGASRT